MKKSKVLLLAAALAPLILIPARMLWSDMQAFADFMQYFERISEVMDESADSNRVAEDANYSRDVASLNEEIAARMERIYQNYGAGGDSNMNTAIALTRGLFEELFRLRSEFAAAVEPFLSGRMHDRETVKDKASYEWRAGVLDGIHRYMSGHHARVEQIMENFRQTVAGSDLPEKYKQFVWQEWARDLNDRLHELGPEVERFEREIADYRRLFDYLYEYSDIYYVSEDGRIVVTNDRHLKEYQSIAKAVGHDW